MEGVQARVQESVNGMINTIDKDHLRGMQGNMYHCSARCCENPNYNMEDVQRCIEKCGLPLNKAQNYIQTELGGFQDRLQRCAMDCQDSVRDKLGPGVNEADVPKHRAAFESCVVKCGDSHIALVPQMMKRMKEMLKMAEKQ